MDPVTAFSLACGVLQVIQFGFDLASGYKEFREAGSWDNLNQVKDLTEKFSGGCHLVESTVKNASTGNLLSSDDQELLDLAKKCLAVAEALRLKIAQLKPKDPKSRLSISKALLKRSFHGSDVEKMQNNLGVYQTSLNTRILARISARVDFSITEQATAVKDVNALIIQQSGVYQTVNDEFRTCLDRLVASQNALQKSILDEGSKRRDDIATNLTEVRLEAATNRLTITNDGDITRKHISDTVAKQMEKDVVHEFLNSLAPKQLNERYNQVKDSHRLTCSWILDPPGAAEKLEDLSQKHMHSLIDWLEHGTGVYWLSGKAGSGKSTLMKYILEEGRTLAYLHVWSGSAELIMPFYFCWKAGGSDQKSMNGLFRSFLHQILLEFPELIPIVSNLRKKVGGSTSNWTLKNLERALHSLFQQSHIPLRFCLFIDGLDELEDSTNDLLLFIDSVKPLQNVKICASSRPELVYINKFQNTSRLRLEYLNRKDIQNYIEDRLPSITWTRNIPNIDSVNFAHMRNELIRKADGVFLWVVLALEHLIRGMENGDSATELGERLRTLHGDLDGLFGQLIAQIEKPYNQEAAIYMQLLLTSFKRKTSLSTIAFATEVLGKDPCAPGSKATDRSAYGQGLIDLKARIQATCAGLITVEAEDGDLASVQPVSDDYEGFIHGDPSGDVMFLHRSVFDYLDETENGRAFLKHAGSALVDVHKMHIKSLLNRFGLYAIAWGVSIIPGNCSLLRNRILVPIGYHAREVESILSSADQTLMQFICNQFGEANTQFRQSHHSAYDHWASLFGFETVVHLEHCDGNITEVGRQGAIDLSVMATLGLDNYVQAKLNEDVESSSVSRCNLCLAYVILHSTAYLLHKEPKATSFRLACELLIKGANPQTVFNYCKDGFSDSTTAWKELIIYLWRSATTRSIELEYLIVEVLEQDHTVPLLNGVPTGSGRMNAGIRAYANNTDHNPSFGWELLFDIPAALVLKHFSSIYACARIEEILSKHKTELIVKLVHVTYYRYLRVGSPRTNEDWNNPPTWLSLRLQQNVIGALGERRKLDVKDWSIIIPKAIRECLPPSEAARLLPAELQTEEGWERYEANAELQTEEGWETWYLSRSGLWKMKMYPALFSSLPNLSWEKLVYWKC